MDAGDLKLRRFLTSELDDAPLFQPLKVTFSTLIRHPGQLTAEYIIGRRKPYIRPFRLFLLISLAFFLVQPYTGLFRYTLDSYETLPFLGDDPGYLVKDEIARRGTTYAEYEKEFDKTIATQKKTMMLVMVPLVAVGLAMFFRKRRFAVHLVFSVHYMAVLLLYMLAVWLMFITAFAGVRQLYKVMPLTAQFISVMLDGEAALTATIFVPLFFFVRRAMEVAYGVSRRRAGLGSLALIFWQLMLIVYFYRISLFFTTFFALRLGS